MPEAGKQSIWEIDPKHSLVEFSVKHMMFTTVKGRFTDVRGTITCVDEADPSLASVNAQIGATSIDTGDPDRDAHLRGADFLDVEKYPSITFKSTRVERRSEDQFRVIGDLTIRDITREVALETTYNGRGTNPWGKEVSGFTAETSINRKDFGLKWNVALESGGLLVGDKINVLLEIQAINQD
jgi:polyisoprenoid-binding protein YceI